MIIASYWIIGKGKKDQVIITEGFALDGIIAFVLGAVVAYVTGNIAVFFIGPINGIVVSMVSYILLNKLFKNKKVKA